VLRNRDFVLAEFEIEDGIFDYGLVHENKANEAPFLTSIFA